MTGLTEVYTDTNAGSSKTLSVSAFTINDGNAGNNYTVTSVNSSSGVIYPALLSITATTNTKNFDGTTGAAAIPTVAGLQGNDTVTGLAEVYSDPIAGPGKTLSVSSFTVNDSNSGNNYTVTTATDTTGFIYSNATVFTNNTVNTSQTPVVYGGPGHLYDHRHGNQW